MTLVAWSEPRSQPRIFEGSIAADSLGSLRRKDTAGSLALNVLWAGARARDEFSALARHDALTRCPGVTERTLVIARGGLSRGDWAGRSADLGAKALRKVPKKTCRITPIVL